MLSGMNPFFSRQHSPDQWREQITTLELCFVYWMVLNTRAVCADITLQSSSLKTTLITESTYQLSMAILFS